MRTEVINGITHYFFKAKKSKVVRRFKIEKKTENNFPDDVWNIIKDYMIDKLKHKLTEKLKDTGIDTLVKILRKEFKTGFSNMKSSSIPLEKRRNLIITTILKCSKQSKNENDILKLYYAEKDKKECSWVNNYSIGEELLCCTGEFRIWARKAKVLKINKNSITVGLYSYTKIEDEYAIRNQTYGTNRLIWCSFINDKKIIYNEQALTKQADFRNYQLNCFIEGEQSCDYGR